MWTLLRVLTSPDTWRMLLRSDTWRQSRVSLRRAHKDARARKQRMALVGVLLSPFLLFAYVGLATGGFAREYAWPAIIGWLLGLMGIAIVAFYRSKRPPQDDGPITLNIAEKIRVPDPPALNLSAELRREFADRALLCAVLAHRAGSERFLKTKVLAEGMEIVTRQRHMALLREHGLYDRLGKTERDLLLAADGHWTDEQVEDGTLQLEALRLLRWTLCLDSFLPLVGSSLLPDYKMSFMAISAPEAFYGSARLVEIGDLRIALQAADQYLYRCWTEGLHRKLFTAEHEENLGPALEYAARLHGNEDDDLLLGDVIVSNAPDEMVRFATNISLRRYRILDWVRLRMYGEVGVSAKLEGFWC